MPRGRPKTLSAPTTEDAVDVVFLSVKLRSGRFESSLSVPLYAGKEAKQEALDQWFEMIQFAFKTGAREMRATFDEREGSADGR